jgi:hypothetical protein
MQGNFFYGYSAVFLPTGFSWRPADVRVDSHAPHVRVCSLLVTMLWSWLLCLQLMHDA